MNSVVRDFRIAQDVPTKEFRGAMRHLPGGVSVITVGRGKDISGMTVTSLSSFSAESPTVVTSINLQSSSWLLLKRYGSFGANILNANQLDVAERFSGKAGERGVERFAGAEWVTRVTGAPLLVGALATLDCEVEEVVERHSHALVIGRVVNLQTSASEGALAYWRGQYLEIDREQDSAKIADVGLPTSRALWHV